jgi:hypothetical protein
MNVFHVSVKNGPLIRRQRVLSTVVAILGVVSCVTSARACNLTVGSGETRSICTGSLVTDCVDVAATGRIEICGGYALILTGSGGNNVSTINGSIELEGAGTGAVLGIITNDHTLAGSGQIIGEDPDATIQISSGLTLTSTTTIEGALQIITGTFMNNGTVEANGPNPGGVLDINPDVLGGSGNWKVTHSNATLRFTTGSTSLTGDFLVSAGTLDILDDVETTGDLTFSGGQIYVAANKRFVANN